MTLVIIAILSITVLPRFFNLSVFQQRVFFDDTLNAIRYAQKLAVATACNVQVAIAGNAFTITRPAATDRSQCASTNPVNFSLNVARPGSRQSSYTGSQSGIALTGSTFYFTAKGNASVGQTLSVGGQQIIIVDDTGFVYAP